MIFLLETTLYVSVTALFILLFKQIFKNRLSAKLHVLIWLLLAARMVIPTLPESPFSVFNAFDIPKNAQEVQTDFSETMTETDTNTQPAVIPEASTPPQHQTDNISGEQAENNHPQQTALPKHNTTKHVSADFVVKLARWCGTAVLLLYFLLIYIVNVTNMKRHQKAVDNETLQLLTECIKVVGVKRRISIAYYGKNPMLMGVIRPVIVIPEDYSENEKRDIIIHELCHLKNGDIFSLWLAVFLLCTSWYNPIIWLCFFTFRRDIEVYCDSRVLEYAVNKKEYAALLVKTALKRNSFIAGTTSLQNGEKEVERRIKYMAYFKKPKVVLTIVITVIALIISVISLTNAKNDDKTKETAVKLNDEIYEAFLKGNKKVEINDNQYFFTELSDSQMYYCFSDMNNDGNNEMHLKTSAEYYIFTVKNGNMTVWYRGSVYENPTKEGNIVYLRNGGAPDNVTERFITLDDNGNVIKEDSAEKYDEDCNGSFDRFFFNGEEIAENSFNDLTAPYRLQTIIYMNNRTEIEPHKLKVLENTANFYLDDRTDEYYYEIYDNNGKTILSDTSAKFPAFNHLDGSLYELQIGFDTFAWQSSYINVETGWVSELYSNPFHLTNGVIAYVNTAEALADDGKTPDDDIILIRLYDLHEQKYLYAVDAEFLKESSVTYQIEYEDNTHIAVTYYTENGQKENRKIIEIPSLV